MLYTYQKDKVDVKSSRGLRSILSTKLMNILNIFDSFESLWFGWNNLDVLKSIFHEIISLIGCFHGI